MNDLPTMLVTRANISPCQKYRTVLIRVWDYSKPILVVSMLNPSTANAEHNDPTIITLIKRAVRWGYGGLLVVNLFPYRAPDPFIIHNLGYREVTAMFNSEVQTYEYWWSAMHLAKETTGWLLVAWGNHGSLHNQQNRFWKDAMDIGVKLKCLGTTLSGAPKHPLARGTHRIPDDREPIDWWPIDSDGNTD